jgi:hypothetical protein
MKSVFTREFQNELRRELKRIAKGYQVCPSEEWLKVRNRRLIPVDIILKSAEKWALIEIESPRQDPLLVRTKHDKGKASYTIV